jgi:hypothetical protein
MANQTPKDLKQAPPLAATMYPHLSPEARAQDKARALDVARQRERNREMARDLRELRIHGKITGWR